MIPESKLEHLDGMCEDKVRDYFDLLLANNDFEPLSDWDALAASDEGCHIYELNTDWEPMQCFDRAMNIASRVLDELRTHQQRMTKT